MGTWLSAQTSGGIPACDKLPATTFPGPVQAAGPGSHHGRRGQGDHCWRQRTTKGTPHGPSLPVALGGQESAPLGLPLLRIELATGHPSIEDLQGRLSGSAGRLVTAGRQHPDDKPCDQPEQDEPEQAHGQQFECAHSGAIPTHHGELLLDVPSCSEMIPAWRPSAAIVLTNPDEAMWKSLPADIAVLLHPVRHGVHEHDHIQCREDSDQDGEGHHGRAPAGRCEVPAVVIAARVYRDPTSPSASRVYCRTWIGRLPTNIVEPP